MDNAGNHYSDFIAITLLHLTAGSFLVGSVKWMVLRFSLKKNVEFVRVVTINYLSFFIAGFAAESISNVYDFNIDGERAYNSPHIVAFIALRTILFLVGSFIIEHFVYRYIKPVKISQALKSSFVINLVGYAFVFLVYFAFIKHENLPGKFSTSRPMPLILHKTGSPIVYDSTLKP